MANPIVTFEMENGDIMKAELYPGNCSEHSEQLYFTGSERIL